MSRFYDEFEKRFEDVISEEEVSLQRHVYIVAYKEDSNMRFNVISKWIVAHSEREAIDKLMKEKENLELSDIIAVSEV